MNHEPYDDFLTREQLRARYKSAYEWLGSPWTDADLKKKTLATFDASRQPKAADAINLFFADLHGTLVFYGPFGVGKTHLLAALCNMLVESGKAPRFTTAPNLFAALQHRIRNNQDHTDLIRSASTCPLLIIDDVDKAKWSEFREEMYFAIIDNRVKRELPTAISTNRLTEIATFTGGAVASRLTIGQLAIELKGEDYRPHVK